MACRKTLNFKYGPTASDWKNFCYSHVIYPYEPTPQSRAIYLDEYQVGDTFWHRGNLRLTFRFRQKDSFEFSVTVDKHINDDGNVSDFVQLIEEISREFDIKDITPAMLVVGLMRQNPYNLSQRQVLTRVPVSMVKLSELNKVYDEKVYSYFHMIQSGQVFEPPMVATMQVRRGILVNNQLNENQEPYPVDHSELWMVDGNHRTLAIRDHGHESMFVWRTVEPIQHNGPVFSGLFPYLGERFKP